MCFEAEANPVRTEGERICDQRAAPCDETLCRRDERGWSNHRTKASLQMFQAALAGGKTRTGLEDHDRFSLEKRPKFLYALKIDKARPVDSDKAFRCQLLFQVSHCRADEVRLLPHVQPHIVPLGFHPIDLARS